MENNHANICAGHNQPSVGFMCFIFNTLNQYPHSYRSEVPSPTITEFQLGINDSYTYTWARNSSSNDLSNAGGTFNQNGNLLIYVQTDINCADVSVDLINAAIFYTIPLSNTSTPMIWTGFMRLNQPDINYLTEAALGGYNLTIHATPQGSGSESGTVFVNVFSIEAPTTPNQTNWTEIIIIIAVVAAAAVTILLIIRTNQTSNSFNASRCRNG